MNKIKKVIAFGASNRKNSINKQLADWAAKQVQDSEVNTLDLNDFEMPIYSLDRESEDGIPGKAIDFRQQLEDADGIIISFAEYNGSYTSAFKNIFDWTSRIGPSIWPDVPMFLMSTSPGPRGGAGVLATAVKSFPFQGAKLMGSFSLPSFQKNFDPNNGIVDLEFKKGFEDRFNAFKEIIRRGGKESLAKAS